MKRLSLLALVLVAWGAENPASQARVLIYQDHLRGFRANPIFFDGVEVASLRQRWSYFVLQTSPGEHVIAGRHKEHELVLNFVPGKDYYVRLDEIRSYPGFYEKLTQASCVEVRSVVDSGKLHPILPTDVRDSGRVSLKMLAPACAD